MNQPKPLTFKGPVSGFPEYLPAQQRAFQQAVARVQKVYESFGFTPLETAAVERVETLISKGIAAKEVYGLRRLAAEGDDAGAKDSALRFDLTVPLARYVVQNANELVFPFRRYQVQPVWRGERAQAGRYRQFYQFDIDTIGDGTLPLAADAEILAAGYTALKALDIGPFTMRVNNRKLLAALLDWAGFEPPNHPHAIKLIDDAEKVGWEKTMALLQQTSPQTNVQGLVDILTSPLNVIPAKAGIQSDTTSHPVGIALSELTTVLTLARAMAGLEEDDPAMVADLTIARGLDYYTGTVIETRLHAAPELGSIMSGGRYDNLTASLGKKQMPGVGVSIGISRLCAWMLTQPAYQLPATPATCFVACHTETLLPQTSRAAAMLRAQGHKVEQHMGGQALGTQLKNAAKRGITTAIIIGPAEADAGTQIVKNLQTGEQKTTPVGVVG